MHMFNSACQSLITCSMQIWRGGGGGIWSRAVMSGRHMGGGGGGGGGVPNRLSEGLGIIMVGHYSPYVYPLLT